MKISFITTVFNEKKNIGTLLDSLLTQSKFPDEIIIVDGGSSDHTVSRIKNQESKIRGKKIKFKLFIKKGNRSVGRNEAIRQATGDIIVCSDAGNILDKKWIENIIRPFNKKNVDVVAGYYKSKPKNIFQKCLTPYVLVMPDKVDSENFLPATRSIAFTKKIWEKVGGFDEKLSHNEDYVFAHRLKEKRAKIVFAKDAIVNWIPRNTLKEAFTMFFRFALGDAESGILRTSVLLLLARYFIGFYLIFLTILYKSLFPLSLLLTSLVIYIIWTIRKNYKYVEDKKALVILPVLQLTADASVLSGTIFGLLKSMISFNLLHFVKYNKFLFFMIIVYIGILLLTINFGIPNQNHPFPYHMDEWHQLQAVRTVFTQGSPNVAGSANGSMLHFLLSGIYLIPLAVLGILNPFAIKSSVTSLETQQRLFEILRLNTLIFGALSIITFAYILKKYFKHNPLLASILFIFNPMWLSLSNYFKYDIALIFWILLGLLFLLRFATNPNTRNYIIAGVICSLSFAVKLSAIPLLPVYALSFFIYFPKPLKNIHKLASGIFIYLAVFILLGVPDLIFGQGNIYEYLDSNLRRAPAATSNLLLGMDYSVFLLGKLYPYAFGHALYVLFLISIPFSLLFIKKREYTIIIISFIFFSLSLIPLKIDARANRLLVLMPFASMFASLLIARIYKSLKRGKLLFAGLILIIITVQLLETFSWVWMKISPDPRFSSSVWLRQNIRQGTKIGIEAIPIYQMLPDLIVKEFYNKQYGIPEKSIFKYEVINSRSASLPPIIVITNGEIESKYFIKSPKKDLIERLKKEKYKIIAIFEPDLRYYKLYGNDLTFYFSSLVISPNEITIFSKNY